MQQTLFIRGENVHTSMEIGVFLQKYTPGVASSAMHFFVSKMKRLLVLTFGTIVYKIGLQQIFDSFEYSLEFWYLNSKINIRYSFTYVL